MSKFSGKCDFCDHLFMGANNEQEAFDKFNGTRLYVIQPLPDDVDFLECLKQGVNIPETYYKRINYTSIKDLIPYYPYIIVFSVGGNNPEKSVTCLSSISYVDEEEEMLLKSYLEQVLKYFRRCKRKKIPFDVNKIVEELSWGIHKEIYHEIANRVKEKGNKATIDGIHLPFSEYSRKELVGYMLKNGVDPKEYGYERFCIGVKKNEVSD